MEKNLFGENDVIDTYSRAEAIADGVLIDVTKTAQEAGFKYPIAITSAVYNTYIVPSKALEKLGQSIQGRLWDVLNILLFRIRLGKGGNQVNFSVLFQMDDYPKKPKLIALKSICHGGDNAEPVITISLPNED